jgi:glucose/arabinose dehydrogenase
MKASLALSALLATLPLACRSARSVAVAETPDAAALDADKSGAIDSDAPPFDDGVSEGAPSVVDGSGLDEGPDAPDEMDQEAAGSPGPFCSLPGSVVWTDQGAVVMPGGDASSPDIGWLHLPVGFCAHYFATVKTVRQLRFAPGGELFAASPTTQTTGYGVGHGVAGIVALADDDHDGNADANITFLDQLPSIQGLMFAAGYLYYQDGSTIRRVAYRSGDRLPSAPSEVVTTFDTSLVPQDGLHWPKVLDQALDGTIYISNGGSQIDACDSTWPVRGAIFKLGGDGSTSPVAIGFRNPIALRCESNHDVCLAVELALDYSASAAGREKLVPIRQDDNWGFPCCATQNVPYAGVTYSGSRQVPDCSGVAVDTDSFVIGHTPFGLDFETARWPAPWTGRVFVTLHGDAGSWRGARVVAFSLDPSGMPVPASELDGGSGDMLEFATGWDDGKNDHGRPAPIAFSPDGRMFLGDDVGGAVIWIAPVDLMQ